MRPPQAHHRVLLANTPTIAGYPAPMAPRPSLTGNMMQSVGRQPPLYPPQQQVVTQQQFPHQYTPYLPGQGTQMPINLMPNPAAAAQMMTSQLALQAQQPQLQAPQQAPLLRPGHNTMMVFTPEQQQQQHQQHLQQQQPQQSASLPQTTKKRSSAIKIIDPSTNTEVNVKSKDSAPVLPEKTSSGESSDNQVKDSQVKEDFKKKVAAVSSNPYQPQPQPQPPVQIPVSVSSFVPTAASEELYLPNAIITKPPNEPSKPKVFPPVLDGPSDSQIPPELGTGGDSAVTRADDIVTKSESVNLTTNVSPPEVESTAGKTVPVATSASHDNVTREEITSEGTISRSENSGSVVPQGDTCTEASTTAEPIASANGSEIKEGEVSGEGQGLVASEKPVAKEELAVEVKSEPPPLLDNTQASQKSLSSGNSSTSLSDSQAGVGGVGDPVVSDGAEVAGELQSSSAASNSEEGLPAVQEKEVLMETGAAVFIDPVSSTSDQWSTADIEEPHKAEPVPVDTPDNGPASGPPGGNMLTSVEGSETEQNNLKNIMNGNVEEDPDVGG